MDAISVDTPGVQGAQHKGSNEATHAEYMRILRKFCAGDPLTHAECGLVRFIFSDDRRNCPVFTNVLAPIATQCFTDMFTDRALRLSAVLHDQSLVRIDGAADIIVEAQADWLLRRRDATTDFYLHIQSDGIDLPIPPDHLPKNALRASFETCASLGCNMPRHTGNDHTTDPFPYCGKACALATIATMRADTTERTVCKRPGCGRLVWIGQDRSGAPHKFCGRTCSRLYLSVQASNAAATDWDFISSAAYFPSISRRYAT